MAVLWKDRKRICGLPITFTKYRLEGERLYVTKGLLRTVEDETLLYRVLDISLERTLADKIFGVGTIVLHCADQTHPQLRLENVRHSENVRAMLSEKIEEERSRARVAGREMYGAANSATKARWRQPWIAAVSRCFFWAARSCLCPAG